MLLSNNVCILLDIQYFVGKIGILCYVLDMYRWYSALIYYFCFDNVQESRIEEIVSNAMLGVKSFDPCKLSVNAIIEVYSYILHTYMLHKLSYMCVFYQKVYALRFSRYGNIVMISILLQAKIYYDIHVTPQAPYSYVSFETNMEEVYNTVCMYIFI